MRITTILGTCGFLLAISNVADVHAQDRKPPQQAVTIERDVEYGSAGERKLLLDIYRPANAEAGAKKERLAAIVFIHGGGWAAGNKAGGGGLSYFAQTGNYVGFSIGYRLTGEAIWPAQIEDCKAAIRWIRAHADDYHIDPDRIGLWGPSAGGHLVSLLGTSSDVKELEGNNGTPGVSTRVACVVDFCGPADFLTFRHDAANRLFGGRIEDHREQARLASPLTHVTPDDPPILIVHGTDDRTVPISQSEAFAAALKKAGVDVTFVRIEGGGHGIRSSEARQRVVRFFEKHLRGQDVEVSGEPIPSEDP